MTLHRGALFAVSFYAGLGTMAFEMVLGRALVPYFGGTIYTWGALIAVFLLGMSFGFFIGGRLADRYPRIGFVAGLLFACGAVILCTPLYSEPLCLALLDAVEDVRVGALVASLAMAFLPALLFAAVSPVAVRLALVDVAHSGLDRRRHVRPQHGGQHPRHHRHQLLPRSGHRLAGHLLPARRADHRLRRGAVRAPSRQGARGGARGPGAGRGASMRATRRGASAGLGHGARRRDREVESEYNNVFVIKQGQMLYMNFGYRNSQYVESVIDMLDPRLAGGALHRYMTIAAVYNERFERAAFVGLGGGRTASYLVDSFPQLGMEIAELDPEVIRLAKKYFGVKESERLKIHAQDGRIFLTRSKARTTRCSSTPIAGRSCPFHLMTKEYFEIIKKHLRPGAWWRRTSSRAPWCSTARSAPSARCSAMSIPTRRAATW